jgi:hypothetical protein
LDKVMMNRKIDLPLSNEPARCSRGKRQFTYSRFLMDAGMSRAQVSIVVNTQIGFG